MRCLIESDNKITGNTISFIDIDETTFHTYAKVNVIKDGKVVRELDNKQFNTDVLKDGESYDFSQFRDAKVFNQTSEPIEPIVNKIQGLIKSIKKYNKLEKVIFLTARADFDDKELFLKTFKAHGIDVELPNVYIERSGNLTHINNVADRKRYVILKYLQSGEYTAVRMFDDDISNLRVFNKLGEMINSGHSDILNKVQQKYPRVSKILFFPLLVDKNGKIHRINSMIKESKINEYYDYDYDYDDDYDDDSIESALRKYVKNNMKYNLLSHVKELKQKYGNKESLTLYRGLNFDTRDELKNFLSSIKSGFYNEKNLSAWTKDENQARQFAITKPSYMEFMSPENWAEIVKQNKAQERLTGYIGIVLQINIKPYQGIDLKDFSSEDEVLLTEGQYKIIDIKKILPFRKLLKEKENQLLNFFEDLNDNEYELAIKWLLYKKNETLYDENIINFLFEKDWRLIYLLDPNKLSNNIRHKLFLKYMLNLKEYLKTNPEMVKIQMGNFKYDNIINVHFINLGEEGLSMFLENDIKTFGKFIKPIIKNAIDKVANAYLKNIDKFPQIKWEVSDVSKYFQLTNLEDYYNNKIGVLIRQQWNKLQDKQYANTMFQSNKSSFFNYIKRTLKSLTLTESQNQ